MRLLVSVSNTVEAAAALSGGADIIDAKDPLRGTLGPVTLQTLTQIHDVCGRKAPLTAALGDVAPDEDIEESAAAFAAAGAGMVKVGFAGDLARSDIASVLRAAMRGVMNAAPVGSGVIAVAYADATTVCGAAPDDVLTAAALTGVAGILLDTANKHGPGLRSLMSRDALSRWIAASREGGLMVAVAGKLSADDIDWLAPMDVDIVGVRGAACEAGRTSEISASRVRMLRARCAAAFPQQRSLM